MPGQGERMVAKGKVTLQQAVDILAKHKETGGEFGQEEIVKQYGLNAAATAGTLRHFFIFGMFETNTRKHESVTPDPLVSGKDWVERAKVNTEKVKGRHFDKTLQVSDIGKDPLRLEKKKLDASLEQLEKQKSRAKADRERFMLEAERWKTEEEEKPKR